MNDRFVFRVWFKKTKEMLDWWTIKQSAFNSTGLAMLYLVFTEYVNSPDHVVMQSTGEKDKNEKLIFEGDIIIKHYEGTQSVVKYGEQSISHDWRGIGFYCDDGTRFQGNFYGGDSVEIIGNIYKNPELLEKQS